MVTAELAFALPALVLVTAGLLWALGLGMAQAQLVQATREGARVAARGESAASVRAAVHRSVPEAQVSVHTRVDGLVSVTTAVRREPPLRVLRPLARGLSATATTAVEQP